MSLEQIGADARVRALFQSCAAAGTELGRISFASHEQYRVLCEDRECDAAPAGRLRWEDELPAVGDWVAARRVDPAFVLIAAVLPRRTQFARRAAGRTAVQQVIAANIDVAAVVCGLDGDFNVPRLERYLVLARESGVEPAIVLNKADLCRSIPQAVQQATTAAGGTPVVVLNAQRSVEPLAPLVRGRTVAFLGSSGAGKSTIVNGLLGEARQATAAVRPGDSRGRHTTTSRMLIPLPAGGAIIDSPGMRELQLWAGEEALAGTFEDLAALAEGCRFADCTHSTEPGCAVRAAIEKGQVEPARWQSYRKLQKELRHQSIERDAHARILERKRYKSIGLSLRQHPKNGR